MDLAQQVMDVTGIQRKEAEALLEAANFDVELAVNLHIGFGSPTKTAFTSPAAREMLSDPSSNNALQDPTSSSSSSSVPTALDFMQQTMGEDGVRAPIQRQTNRLVDDMRPTMRTRARHASSARSPFADIVDPTFQANKKLGVLFQPPNDINCQLSFSEALAHAHNTKKLLLVSIQKIGEFSSLVLNRDIWSDPAVRSVIMTSFVLWQRMSTTADGNEYMRVHPIIPEKFPHVAVIEPETSYRIHVFSDLENKSAFLDSALQVGSAHDSGMGGPQDTKKSAPPSSTHADINDDTTAADIMYVDSDGEEFEFAEDEDDSDGDVALVSSHSSHNDNGSGIYIHGNEHDGFSNGHPEDPATSRMSHAEGTVDGKESMPSARENGRDGESERQDMGCSEVLREEPPKDDPTSATLKITFPDNTSLIRRFYEDESVHVVAQVITESGKVEPSATFSVVQTRPRRNLLDLPRTTTFKELGIKRGLVRVEL